jgi:hypothetical protein
MMRARRAVLALALWLAPLAGPALAEPAPPPDLSGFWAPDLATHPHDATLKAKLPENTVVLDDSGITEFPSGEFGGLRPRPEALARAMAWKPQDEMSLTRVCAAPSIVYAIQGPFPFEIHQTPTLIVLRYEYFDQVRLVFMDGRGHPPAEAPHSKTGHSVGRWEDGELVIETSHLAAATITNNGLDHSDKVRMVERYRLSADGQALVASQWFEDPETLENRGARFIHWRKRPTDHIYPYDCDPSLALQYQEMDAAPAPPR